jgi:NAD(P)H-quinone oxidoreductase subunit 5
LVGLWFNQPLVVTGARDAFLTFAYDFYTAKLYRVTIIFVVGLISNTMYWIDRYIVDGFVNLVGIATVFSGQSLKYNVSGQTQFYALTIILGVTLLLGFFTLNLF